MSITADQAAADLASKPKTKRDRVAGYLIRNDCELFAKGARLIDVADVCGCCTATVRAARARIEELPLFWYPRRWPKLSRHTLGLLPAEWSAIRDRLLEFADSLPGDKPGGGLQPRSPDFATRWLVNNRNCAGLTVATVVAAGRSIGWKHW